MNRREPSRKRATIHLLSTVLFFTTLPAAADLYLGAAELVQADGIDIAVPGYSVPSFVDWNNDGLKDLIVGEGSGAYEAKVRIYLNVGTSDNPQFSTYTYAQSEGADLILPGGG